MLGDAGGVLLLLFVGVCWVEGCPCSGLMLVCDGEGICWGEGCGGGSSCTSSIVTLCVCEDCCCLYGNVGWSETCAGLGSLLVGDDSDEDDDDVCGGGSLLVCEGDDASERSGCTITIVMLLCEEVGSCLDVDRVVWWLLTRVVEETASCVITSFSDFSTPSVKMCWLMNSLGHYSNVSIDIKPSLFKVFIFVLFSDSDSKYLMIYKVIAKYTEILYILCPIISCIICTSISTCRYILLEIW